MFGRVKSLDAILATAERKSLPRSLGALQLTLLGVGAVIGTGIFVLTSEAAQRAGPGMMISFVIAGFVCAVAALCYSELSSMVPVSGSAYTYTYAVMGELLAWMVGWALILEYAVAAGAVSVGWSGYFVGLMSNSLGIEIPFALANGPFGGGLINLPAAIIALAVTTLLLIGTKESATVNTILVVIKVVALTAFIAISLPLMDDGNFQPFAPLGSAGIVGAAAIIFFAYVGFDAVSTAAEETRNPQRNVPIGLIGSLTICTIFYLLVAAGAIGSPLGAQPVQDAAGNYLEPATLQFAQRCNTLIALGHEPLACSREALAHVLREIGWTRMGNMIGLAAFLALPSVILIMLYGQTRIFFVMARDGLLPEKLSKIHPRFKTPYIVTMITGLAVCIAAAFFPVGQLAEVSNSGTLFAFMMVSFAVMILRRKEPARHRPFRTPAIWIVGPLAAAGCIWLFAYLPLRTQLFFPAWAVLGLLIYFLYGYRKSHVGRGIVDVPEGHPDVPPQPVPPMPDAPTPGGKDA